MKELLEALAGAGLISDEGFIVLQADGYPRQFVDPADFEQMFGAALAEEDKYAALIAADNNGDGTAKGYIGFFDAWRSAGILG